MKRLVFFLITMIVTVIFLTACEAGDTVPEPYLTQIRQLRDRNVEITKKIQDLNRESSNLRTEYQWNNDRIGIIAGEALAKLGHSSKDFLVSVETLKVVKTK